jgi:hypothetical protein
MYTCKLVPSILSQSLLLSVLKMPLDGLTWEDVPLNAHTICALHGPSPLSPRDALRLLDTRGHSPASAYHPLSSNPTLLGARGDLRWLGTGDCTLASSYRPLY